MCRNDKISDTFILQYIKYKTEHRNKTNIFISLETHSKSRKLLLYWTGQNQCKLLGFMNNSRPIPIGSLKFCIEMPTNRMI